MENDRQILFWRRFMPFKLMFTVILPITWAYGAALYVYEDGFLEWTGFTGVSPTYITNSGPAGEVSPFSVNMCKPTHGFILEHLKAVKLVEINCRFSFSLTVFSLLHILLLFCVSRSWLDNSFIHLDHNVGLGTGTSAWSSDVLGVE